jgi:putative ABC transport system permease protein
MEANYVTYLLLDNEPEIVSLQKQVAEYMQNVSKNEYKVNGQSIPDLSFRAVEPASISIHSCQVLNRTAVIVYIYVLIAIAILILTIACVNYVNLAVAQSSGQNC